MALCGAAKTEMYWECGRPSRDDRAKQDNGERPNFLTSGGRSWLLTMLTTN
jgi:hypothetical protein